MTVYLPAEPLVAALEAIPGLQHRNHRVGRALLRARASGRITLTQADYLAVKELHVHPSAIYGDEWWEAAAS